MYKRKDIRICVALSKNEYRMLMKIVCMLRDDPTGDEDATISDAIRYSIREISAWHNCCIDEHSNT